MEFQPPAGYRASATFGHPLSFLSLSSPSSPGTPQGTPMIHDAATLGSTYPFTTSNKEERSRILDVSQAARRLRNQKRHTAPLRCSRSSISLTNSGSPPEGGSLRAREMMELAQELQKARAITEDFVRSSPKKKSPPEDWRLVKSNTFGSPPAKYGTHVSTSGGSFFDPGHARFPSDSTTSTAFFDAEENDDAGNPDEIKPIRKSLSIITAWPTWAGTPPPLLSPFKEKSDRAAQDDDPLITTNVQKGQSTVYSAPSTDSPVLPAATDQAPLKRTQSQGDTSSTDGASQCSSFSPLKEGLSVQDAPTIVVEHLNLGHKFSMERSEFLAEERRNPSSIAAAQVLGRPTTNYSFSESSSPTLGLSPSIYVSPMHEAQIFNNSLDMARTIKPELERDLSTPSFISGVLQAGLLLEKLKRENTTSFEEDTEAVHLQVLTAVVGTGKQASSSSSLSHYPSEEPPKNSQQHLSSLTSDDIIYMTPTDLSTAARSSPPDGPPNSNLQPPSDHPPRLTLAPAPTFAVGPFLRPSSITVSDSAKGFEVDRGLQPLKLPSTVDTTEPVSTRGEEGPPPDGSPSASNSKPQLKLLTDPSSLNRKPDTEAEEGFKQGIHAVTPRIQRTSDTSTGQSSENHLSTSKRSSTLHPLSASGSASVSPVSPSSSISRASARLTNPFSFLHPSPLTSTSPYSSDASQAGPSRVVKAPEQARSHKRNGTVTPGDTKRPSSARQRLSRLLGGVELGVGKASFPTVPKDKAGAGLVRPDVFGAGEGGESWIQDSRESTTSHERPALSDINADREAATVNQEGKSKKRRINIRPMSIIWLGSNKEKPPVGAQDEKKTTKIPVALQPPNSDTSSWSMLDSNASSAIGNHEGLRILNLPPPPTAGATVDIPKSPKSRSRKSRTHQRSVAVLSGREESESEVGKMKGRNRGSFLGALIGK